MVLVVLVVLLLSRREIALAYPILLVVVVPHLILLGPTKYCLLHVAERTQNREGIPWISATDLT